ncbi:response regulator [Azospirillum halopraeferens]|uniref:response regulator n=1 Tax=Azospirillum halopraeferens TaxID=34010 RepID=UPI0006886E95|nr:response regulator [Azospirillum halopraeferens]
MAAIVAILHLEDSPLDGELACAHLEKAGLICDVERVETRDAFAAALERRRWDLVLADFALPAFDGLAALAIARERTPDTPFVFLSGRMGEDAAIDALKQGATDYVLKERLPRLGPAVRRALAEAAALAERRRAEENLRRLHRAIDDIRDYAILTLDPDGRIVSWNDGSRRIFGYAEADILHRPFDRLFTPEDRAAGVPGRALDRAAAEGRDVADRCLATADGRTFRASCVLTAVQDERGRRVAWSVVVEDVTARHRLEEELRRTRDAADRANAAKSRFLAAATHDLRQPVQSMMFFTAALQGIVDGAPGRALLDNVERGLEALKGLLDGLLDISKLDAGTIEPQVSDFPLAGAVASLSAACGPLARAKGLEWHADAAAAPAVTVRTDRVLLERILRNLVHNAVRYTERGSVRLTAALRDGRVRIAVEDTGVGIPEESLDEIFQEFQQLGNPGRDRENGLGLGLAIVRRLADLLGLPVSVTSAVGRGSVFAVEVPLADAAAQAPGPGAAAAAPAGPAERPPVVVVEDDAVVLLGTTAFLESEGYGVVGAASAAEALDKVRGLDVTPGAIVVDYRLGDSMTGAEVIEAVRALCGAPVPAMILTGEMASQHFTDLEARGVEVMFKPVAAPDLLRRVARLCAGRPEPRRG